jgi:ABC-type transport system involved in multi-copper enzyme maturation permease subunit
VHIATIGKFTALEALRTRLPLTAVLLLLLLLLSSLFVRELAVTEAARFQAVFYCAVARLGAVFLVVVYVLSSMSREFNDKGLEAVLALDVRRSHYILGKLCGFLLASGIVAAVLCLPAFALAPLPAAAAWSLSLGLELALVAALALFCIVTFNQLLPASAFVAGFYLVCRSIDAMRLMSAYPVGGGGEWSQQITHGLVEGLAYLLPALDQWTRAAWLVDAPPGAAELGAIAAQGALYLVLLGAAALFDFHRRSF